MPRIIDAAFLDLNNACPPSRSVVESLLPITISEKATDNLQLSKDLISQYSKERNDRCLGCDVRWLSSALDIESDTDFHRVLDIDVGAVVDHRRIQPEQLSTVLASLVK